MALINFYYGGQYLDNVEDIDAEQVFAKADAAIERFAKRFGHTLRIHTYPRSADAPSCSVESRAIINRADVERRIEARILEEFDAALNDAISA